jgi:hypothetical protein
MQRIVAVGAPENPLSDIISKDGIFVNTMTYGSVYGNSQSVSGSGGGIGSQYGNRQTVISGSSPISGKQGGFYNYTPLSYSHREFVVSSPLSDLIYKEECSR